MADFERQAGVELSRRDQHTQVRILPGAGGGSDHPCNERSRNVQVDRQKDFRLHFYDGERQRYCRGQSHYNEHDQRTHEQDLLMMDNHVHELPKGIERSGSVWWLDLLARGEGSQNE